MRTYVSNDEPHDENVYGPATDVQKRKRASPPLFPTTEGRPAVEPVTVPPHESGGPKAMGGGDGDGGRGDGGGGDRS